MMNLRNCPFVPVVIGCYALFLLLLASPQGDAQVSQQQQVTKFVQELKSADPKVCRRAADALEKIGAPVVPALGEALKDTSSTVRHNSVIALWKIGAPSALPALIEMLKGPAPSDRTSAAYTLSWIGALAASAVPALIQMLKDPDPIVRCSAAYALGQIGAPAAAAVRPLSEALKDKDCNVRSNAAAALEKIKGLK